MRDRERETDRDRQRETERKYRIDFTENITIESRKDNKRKI